MRELSIDPEFRDKIPSLTSEEFRQLRENILIDGEVRDPIVTWNGTILDGHNRWKIIQEYPELPYTVKEMYFPDRWAAIVWICRNQMGRRNITDEQRTLLIGEAYRAQKMSKGGNEKRPRGTGGKFTGKDQTDIYRSCREDEENSEDEFPNTAAKVAHDFGVGEATTKRAEQYLLGVEAAEKVSPGFRESIVSGEVKASKKDIKALKDMPEEKLRESVKTIKGGKPLPSTPSSDNSPQDDFNAKDMEGLLTAATKTLDTTLRIHLVDTHPEILDTDEGRSVAYNALNAIKEVADKYIEIVTSHIEGSEQNANTD